MEFREVLWIFKLLPSDEPVYRATLLYSLTSRAQAGKRIQRLTQSRQVLGRVAKERNPARQSKNYKIGDANAY